jgi:hypothetical protein
MLSDEIRARLQRLHRTSAANFAPVGALLLAAGQRQRRVAPRTESGSSVDDNWLAMAEDVENNSGRHLRIRQPLSDSWPGAAPALAPSAHARAATALPTHAELAALRQCFPTGALFLDLETCGFAGSVVFLAGIVWQPAGALVVDQLFARNYAEERAVLETLWQAVAASHVLVTFNGKSFDWPMVRDRSIRHRLACAATRRAGIEDLVHCDLLHHARRRWKAHLPDCRLQTLERFVCNRHRRGDLSGAEVPLAYHAFVRGGHPAEIGAILHHNRLDLVTLVQIALRLMTV